MPKSAMFVLHKANAKCIDVYRGNCGHLVADLAYSFCGLSPPPSWKAQMHPPDGQGALQQSSLNILLYGISLL